MRKWVLVLIIAVVFICLTVGFVFSIMYTNSVFFNAPRNFVKNLLSEGSITRFGFINVFNIDETMSDDIIGIECIKVACVSSDITIHMSEQNYVSVKLYGTFGTSGSKPVKLTMDKKGSTLYFDVEYPKKFSINTSSDMKLDVYLPKSYEREIQVDSVSADIYAEELFNSKYKFKTVSGDITLILKTSDSETHLDLESVSGDVCIEYLNPFGTYKNLDSAKIKTISGDVEIKLTGDSAFKLQYNSTSGKLKSDFPMTIKSIGRNSSSGTVNQGNSTFDIDTVSGDLKIVRK